LDGQSRQGIALFSVRIEFYRGAASGWVVTLVIPGFNESNDELTGLTEFLAGVSPDIPWHVTAFHKDPKRLIQRTLAPTR
jgi:pyruvate-formate lyase-activating enzyme